MMAPSCSSSFLCFVPHPSQLGSCCVGSHLPNLFSLCDLNNNSGSMPLNWMGPCQLWSSYFYATLFLMLNTYHCIRIKFSLIKLPCYTCVSSGWLYKGDGVTQHLGPYWHDTKLFSKCLLFCHTFLRVINLKSRFTEQKRLGGIDPNNQKGSNC